MFAIPHYAGSQGIQSCQVRWQKIAESDLPSYYLHVVIALDLLLSARCYHTWRPTICTLLSHLTSYYLHVVIGSHVKQAALMKTAFFFSQSNAIHHFRILYLVQLVTSHLISSCPMLLILCRTIREHSRIVLGWHTVAYSGIRVTYSGIRVTHTAA